MIYLYAYTNHRADLDHLRRMGALWHALKERGVEAELLVNDYRAQLAGRELGLPAATTIETIMDIDAVAEHGDTVVIDSPEEGGERVKRYGENFSALYRVERFCGEERRYGETMLPRWKGEKEVPELWADPSYERAAGIPKEARTVLFYGDSDAEKKLLAARERFAGLGLELYWGHYFYVKYEADLQESFPVIHESDAYRELLSTSRTVVTASAQTAMEAAVSGASVVFLEKEEIEGCFEEILKRLEIPVVPLGDRTALIRAMERHAPSRKSRTFVGELAEEILKKY